MRAPLMIHLPYVYSFCLTYGIRHIQTLFCDGVLSSTILLHHTRKHYAIVRNIVIQLSITLYGIVCFKTFTFLSKPLASQHSLLCHHYYFCLPFEYTMFVFSLNMDGLLTTPRTSPVVIVVGF